MDKNKVFWISLVALTVLIFAGSSAAVIMDNHSVKLVETANGGNSSEMADAEADDGLTPLSRVPETVNGLLIGFDASLGLTDVMMVAHVDTQNNRIGVVSVPRDLTIAFDDPQFSEIKEKNGISNGRYCKLNEVYGMLGYDDNALQTVKEIITIITGLDIDYMATIDVNGFKDVIDALGGIEFNVPQRMYYSDPVQDLYIDLQPGLQVLNGQDAMGLVRFRHYKMGDLQRIAVQQQFLHATFSQIMAVDDFSVIKKTLMTGYNIFEADFGFVTAMNYAQYFYELGTLEEILNTRHMVTIPSYGQQRNGIWYQLWDMDEAHQVVQDMVDGVLSSGDLSDSISDEAGQSGTQDSGGSDSSVETEAPAQNEPETSPMPEGENSEGENSEGEAPEGETTVTETPEGENPEGETPVTETPEGENPEGEVDGSTDETPEAPQPSEETPVDDGAMDPTTETDGGTESGNSTSEDGAGTDAVPQAVPEDVQ